MVATEKRTPTPRRRTSKAQTVPVRVVKATQSRRPAPPSLIESKTESPLRLSKAPQLQPADKDRRKVMWAGVAVAAAIIFVVWIAIVRLDLGGPTTSDSLFGRISQELKNLFSFGDKNSNLNAADRELNDLRERVFPELDENVNRGTFNTSNTNSNSNSNANSATNTNSSSNNNSSANSNTSF